jgi:hypothetical protein
MRRCFELCAVVIVSICLAACGKTSNTSDATSTATDVKQETVSTTPTHAPPAPAKTKADADHDNDLGAVADDKSNGSLLDHGHTADAVDTRAVTALIMRYYAAARREDGSAACSMLYTTLEESVPEDYGQSPPSKPYLRGTTCAAVLTLLFKHERLQIAAEYTKLKVARVAIEERHGIVLLHFGSMPERQIPVEREGHEWKLTQILDGEVP